jgi:hypothetical protein
MMIAPKGRPGNGIIAAIIHNLGNSDIHAGNAENIPGYRGFSQKLNNSRPKLW